LAVTNYEYNLTEWLTQVIIFSLSFRHTPRHCRRQSTYTANVGVWNYERYGM